VIVRKDDRGGIQLQRAAQQFPRMHRGPVHGSLKQHFIADEPVAIVQKQAGENLPWQMRELQSEEPTYCA